MALCRGVLVKVDRKEILENIEGRVDIVAIGLMDNPEKLRAALEQAANVFNAAVEWVEGEIRKGVESLMNTITGRSGSIRDGIGISIKNMALDIENGNTGASGADAERILSYVELIVAGVIIAFTTFAALEAFMDASSGGVVALISDVLVGLLKSEIVRAIINVFLIGDASVTALDKVMDRTGHGITEGVVKSLLKAFDIGVSIAGEIWSIYKVFEEKANKGKMLFYVGLALAVASTVATIEGDTLNLHGQELMAYDIITAVLGFAGLSLMYANRYESIENNLAWTGLVE